MEYAERILLKSYGKGTRAEKWLLCLRDKGNSGCSALVKCLNLDPEDVDSGKKMAEKYSEFSEQLHAPFTLDFGVELWSNQDPSLISFVSCVCRAVNLEFTLIDPSSGLPLEKDLVER